MMTTTNIGALYFARLVMGLSNGLFDTFSQLYILVCVHCSQRESPLIPDQECAPAKYRGMMMGFLTYWVTFGKLTSSNWVTLDLSMAYKFRSSDRHHRG